jgi:hypothetical protein
VSDEKKNNKQTTSRTQSTMEPSQRTSAWTSPVMYTMQQPRDYFELEYMQQIKSKYPKEIRCTENEYDLQEKDLDLKYSSMRQLTS